jgi:hypothetical protein
MILRVNVIWVISERTKPVNPKNLICIQMPNLTRRSVCLYVQNDFQLDCDGRHDQSLILTGDGR